MGDGYKIEAHSDFETWCQASFLHLSEIDLTSFSYSMSMNTFYLVPWLSKLDLLPFESATSAKVLDLIKVQACFSEIGMSRAIAARGGGSCNSNGSWRCNCSGGGEELR